MYFGAKYFCCWPFLVASFFQGHKSDRGGVPQPEPDRVRVFRARHLRRSMLRNFQLDQLDPHQQEFHRWRARKPTGNWKHFKIFNFSVLSFKETKKERIVYGMLKIPDMHSLPVVFDCCKKYFIICNNLFLFLSLLSSKSI
jgi:hypothetical protein